MDTQTKAQDDARAVLTIAMYRYLYADDAIDKRFWFR